MKQPSESRKTFIKPDRSFYEFFRGYNIREVMPPPALDRKEFLSQSQAIVRQSRKIALENGLDEDSADKVQMDTIRALSEQSLFFFCIFVLDMQYANNDFVYRLCNDVQYNKWRKLWVIAREHYKSTIITCASTLWEILKDPNLTYCIYSFKEDSAVGFLGQIRMWCENNVLLRRIWADVIWENPSRCSEILPDGKEITWSWNSKQLEFKRTISCKEKTIEAAGLGGNSKTGKHFARQIYDDVETQKNVETPEAIEKLYGEFSMSFNTGQTSNLEFCVVGTFYARADVYATAIKNGIFRESIIQPCVDKDGVPVRFTVEELEEKYRLMGPSVFATQMMNNPSFSSVQAFKAEWVHRWTPNPSGMNLYVVIDPASGKTSKKHDFTTIWVAGIDQFKKLMVFNLIEDKFGVEERFRKLVDIIREYEPLQIFHEQVAMQQDIALLQEYMDKYNTHFAITPFNPTRWGDKESRILKLKDGFEAGKVFLPRQGREYMNYEGKPVDMLDFWYRNEYLGYPTINHDDGLDSLASLYMMLVEGSLRAPAPSFMDRRRNGIPEEEEERYSPMRHAMDGGVKRPSLFGRKDRMGIA